ncbi:MAG: hypothetical protein J5518_00185 [Lachnospiraceae bacterium]|nr:hypothetical protein [Lachnospiraceae bacterium]
MKKTTLHKNHALILTAYAILLLLLLFYFNRMRSTEYAYSYDLNTFSLNAGHVDAEGVLTVDETSGFNGVFADPPAAHLRSGDYTITITYESTGDNKLHISPNSNLDRYIPLPASETQVSETFSVWPASDHFHAWLVYDGSGTLSVRDITITSSAPLYTDYEYFMILTVLTGLLLPVCIWFMWKKLHFTKQQWLTAGLLTLAAFIVSFPVFLGRLWMGTDTRPHLMRMDGVSYALSEHRLPTVIYPNYCNDYGEISCIYPDKFLYLPGLLRNRGVSMVASLGTILFLINLASLLIVYFCAKYMSGSAMAALISAILFTFFPYRMYVMYGGGQALGMGIALMFFPLLFTALYDIFFKDGKHWYLLTIAVAGQLCSHILSFVLGIVLSVITLLFALLILWRKQNLKAKIGKIFLSLLKAVGVFLVTGLSTIVPFVYYYSWGLSVGTMKLEFLNTLQPLSVSFLSESGAYHLLLLVLVIILAACILKKRINTAWEPRQSVFCIYLLIAGFILFWMSTALFPWKPVSYLGPIYSALQSFQFAERFMLAGTSAISLGFAIFVAGIIRAAEDAPKKRLCTGMTALLLVAVFLGTLTSCRQIANCDTCVHDRMTGNIYYKQAGYLPAGTDISFYESSLPNCGDWDSVENLVYLKNGTSVHYEYICKSADNYMEFPLFYYKGYHAYNAEGVELPIINSEHNRIMLALTQSESPQVIDIRFTMHPLFYVSALISLLGTAALYGYIFYTNRSGKQTSRER